MNTTVRLLYVDVNEELLKIIKRIAADAENTNADEKQWGAYGTAGIIWPFAIACFVDLHFFSTPKCIRHVR